MLRLNEEFERPGGDMVGAFRSLSTGVVSDAMGKRGSMHGDIKPVCGGLKMCGPAFTVQEHTADFLIGLYALNRAMPGDVLVIDVRGDQNTAVWGELTSLEAKLKSIDGVVIDGAVRDVPGIRSLDFPVFASAIVPGAGGGEYPGEINVTIQCGGVAVSPGDLVLGDDDGVVVVPRGRIEETLANALRLAEIEEKLEARLREGASLAEIFHVREKLTEKMERGAVPQFAYDEGA